MGAVSTIATRWRGVLVLLGAVFGVLLAVVGGLITTGIGDSGLEALVFAVVVLAITVLVLALVVLALSVKVWRQTTAIRQLQP